MAIPTGGFLKAETIRDDFNAKVRNLIMKLMSVSMAPGANKYMINIQLSNPLGNRGIPADLTRDLNNYGASGTPSQLDLSDLGGSGTVTVANNIVAEVRQKMREYARFQLVKIRNTASTQRRRNAGTGFTARWPSFTIQVVGNAGTGSAAHNSIRTAITNDVNSAASSNGLNTGSQVDAGAVNAFIEECQEIWYRHSVENINESQMRQFSASYCHNNHNSHSSHGSRSRR